ncbi:unnamed protein product, partial [Rotaria sp. Silwood1]
MRNHDILMGNLGNRNNICSFKINDRSLAGNHDNGFCIVINDLEEENGRFNEESVLAQQTLKGIQEFVIEYLIYFLDKENYLPSMVTRENFENTEKYLEENQCDCYRQYIENEKLTINEEQDDENKLKRKSKMKIFCRIVLSAIIINTLSMDIEYHEQPQSLTNALEYCNLVFTSLFAIEMILKIIADGYLQYIQNAYNLFDSAIVIMILIELQGNKNSELSVLRTFRLLRVLKIIIFMSTLRQL